MIDTVVNDALFTGFMLGLKWGVIPAIVLGVTWRILRLVFWGTPVKNGSNL